MDTEGRQEPVGMDGDVGNDGIFQTRYREVTLAAVAFAIVIGVVLNAAITYAGLKIGFTIGGSAIAAVLGFGFLRGVLRKGSILETNVAQTVASAVNTSNSGVIFTVPVLFLIGYQLDIKGTDFWLLTLACVAGALLGTAFIIPLRKQMLDIERLRFPSATAVASILKSPGAGSAKAVVLVIGIVTGAAIYLPTGLPSLTMTANTDELVELFEKEKISWDDVERTRLMEQWIEDAAIPTDVVERGRVAFELKEARVSLRDNQAACVGDTIESDRAEIARLEAELEAMAPIELVDDSLAEHCYRIVGLDEETYDSLRSTKIGWAAKPMFGYSDINWRLPGEPQLVDSGEQFDERGDGTGTTSLRREAEPTDLDGDGNLDAVLSGRVDRDQNGKADLVMTDSTVDVGRFMGLPDEMQLIFAIAPFALGAGFLTGRAGLFVLVGGILAFFVINPVTYHLGLMPSTVDAPGAAGYGFGAFNRPLGIGLLLGGAAMGVLASLPAIKEAVKSIGAASKLRGGSDELGMKTLLVAVVAALVFLYLAANTMGSKPINTTCPVSNQVLADVACEGDPITSLHDGYTLEFASQADADAWETDTETWSAENKTAFMETLNAKPGWLASLSPQLRAALIALIGAIWIWFAGIIIAQCTGMTDWSPISGMALLTVVLVLLLAGTGAVVGAVLVGAALCVAITLAADMMGDMKTGYLVGAKPKRQQVVELIVVAIGPVVAMLTLMLIASANMKTTGIAIGPGTATSAPQAQALQVIITGVQGGEMPYALYGFGALLGALLGLGAFSGLGVLIGLSMYLPFIYIATYGIGCVANIVLGWIKGRTWTEDWGVPFCAGLIVGESLLSLSLNIYQIAA